MEILMIAARAPRVLSEHQLRATLAYYALRTEDIDSRIVQNQSWTPESLRKHYPGLIPRVAAPEKNGR